MTEQNQSEVASITYYIGVEEIITQCLCGCDRIKTWTGSEKMRFSIQSDGALFVSAPDLPDLEPHHGNNLVPPFKLYAECGSAEPEDLVFAIGRLEWLGGSGIFKAVAVNGTRIAFHSRETGKTEEV